MLAKMWKKILLAVCIIACIFNLMSKLVNRHSLETNLKSVNDGNTVLDAIKTENTEKEQSEENLITEEQEIVNSEDNNEENIVEEKSQENIQVTEENREEDDDPMNQLFKSSDFTIIF